MFENVERTLANELKTALGIQVFIGVPDPEILEKTPLPVGAVYLARCRMQDLVPDGVAQVTGTNADGTVNLLYLLGEAEMEFEFQLLTESRRQLDDFTITLLRHFHETPYMGPENEYVIGSITFRDELPGPREEREFLRIFTIPVTGPVTHEVQGVHPVQEVDQDGSTVGYDPL